MAAVYSGVVLLTSSPPLSNTTAPSCFFVKFYHLPWLDLKSHALGGGRGQGVEQHAGQPWGDALHKATVETSY